MNRLTPDELKTHELLRTQKDGEEHASLYHASRVCWLDDSNPGRIITTAHCTRELLTGLSETFGQTLDIPGIISKIQEMVKRHDAAKKNHVFDSDGSLPAAALLPLFEAIEGLRIPKKKDRFGLLVENLEVGTVKLPTEAIENESNQWESIYSYFVGVAHRKPTSIDQMQRKLGEFDELIRRRFQPRPAANISKLLATIRRIENDNR